MLPFNIPQLPMNGEMFSELLCFLSIILSKTESVSFVSQPQPIEYVECGTDLNLKWVYDNTTTVDRITWVANTYLKIAVYDSTSGFSIQQNAAYLPVIEARFAYINGGSSAGVTIKSVKPGDEAKILVDVIFTNLDSLQSTIEIKVIVAPVSTKVSLPLYNTAELGASSFYFSCTFISRPKPEISWFGNGTKFNFDPHKSVVVNNPLSYSSCGAFEIESSLALLNIELKDSQNISCSTFITTYEEVRRTQSTNFQVGYKPGKIYPSSLSFSNSNVPGGSYTNLTCKSNAIPSPTYEVYRDDNKLISGAADGTGSFTYTVGPAKFYDDGIYTCEVKNIYGSESLTAVLNVTVMPQFWGKNLPDVNVTLGNSINIPCQVYGDPLLQSNIVWTKLSGQKTVFVQNHEEVYFNKTVSFRINSLFIEKTTINDSGIYQCIGYNFLGNVTQNVNVQVMFAPQLVDTNLTDGNLTENKLYSYYCIVIGYPKPTITWSAKSNLLPTTNQTILVDIINGYWKIFSTLIVNATLDYFGELYCNSSNGVGSDISRKAVLKFLYKPIVEFSSNVSTLIIDGLPAISMGIDETLKLTCIVKGYELMTVNWYRDNTSISGNVSFGTVVQSIDFGYIQSSTLLIRSSLDENFKIYKCVSETSAGKTESSLKIYVLYGKVTKQLGGRLCFEFQKDAFLDWQFFYSQPISTVKWAMLNEDGSEKFVIGKLTNRSIVSVSMKSSNYDYNNVTNVGLYLRNLNVGDEGWYSVTIDFKNSPFLLTARVYLCVSVNPFNTSIIPTWSTFVVEGKETTLNCSSTAKPYAELFWLLGNQLLINGSDYEIIFSFESIFNNLTTTKSMLHIKKATLAMNAPFVCLAVGMFRNESATKNVTIFYSPKNTSMTIIPNPAQTGDKVRLKCSALANPNLIYYQIYRDDDLQYNGTNSSIDIANVTFADEGEYFCIPVNIIGEGAETSLNLTVNVPPFLMFNNDPQYVNASNKVELVCQFYGDPPLDLNWQTPASSSNVSIKNMLIYQNSSYVIKNTTATITSVGIKNSGVYGCVANNSFDSVTKNITLYVRSDVVFINSSLDQPMVTPLLNSKFTRYCTAIAAPKILKIEWFLDGVLITTKNLTNIVIEDGFYHNVIKSTLVYSSVEKSDTGNLSCVATNNFSQSIKSSNILVQFSPETTLSANLTIVEGKSANFTCFSEGQPLPVLKWLLNKKIITNNEKVNITTNTSSSFFSGKVTSILSIVNISRNDYAGEIECVGENQVNSVAKSVFLNVEFPPDSKIVDKPIYAEQNSLLTLDCYVNANPTASYKWSINGTPISFNGSKYSVPSAYFNNEGNYTCNASNYLGSPGVVFFSVFMLVPPRNINVVCISTDPTYGDRNVTCRCSGYGNPAPEFYWKRKSDPINVLSSSQILQIIVPYESTDDFICYMQNIGGILSSSQPSTGYSIGATSYGYFLYILIPLFVIGAVVLLLFVCKKKRKSVDDEILVPADRDVKLPSPSFVSGFNKKSPIINSGYVVENEFESIEINLKFDHENNVSDNKVGSDINEVKTSSSRKNNFYEELPVDFDMRSLETLDY